MVGKYEFGIGVTGGGQEQAIGAQEKFEVQKSAAVEKNKKIVRAFEFYMEEKKPIFEIRDTLELPFPKADILDAITGEVMASEDENRVQYLKALAAFLADFQDHVGPHPLTLMGVSDNHFLKLRYRSNDNFPDPMGVIERNPDKDKYREFKKLCDRELYYIVSHLAAVGFRRPPVLSSNFAQGMPIAV